MLNRATFVGLTVVLVVVAVLVALIGAGPGIVGPLLAR
jgi:hypothetical protein